LASHVVFAAEQGPITPEELNARLPADLGPARVDVSGYPADQQKNYALFMERCVRCHTAARAINSPLIEAEDWQYFVGLMHKKVLGRKKGEIWTPEEGRLIIDFLSYDSQVRKVEHQEQFENLQKRLALRFEQVQKELDRLAKEPPAVSSAPSTGAIP